MSRRDHIGGCCAGSAGTTTTRTTRVRLALGRLVQNIGEAARRVSPALQDAHPDIPWRNIAGIRHKVVHDYFYVDFDIIWDVVTADLPALVSRLEQIADPN